MSRTRQTIRHLPVAQLTRHPGNIREDVGDLTDLARSVKEHGILQPLVVTELTGHPDQFLILAGHRRLAASLKVGLTSVPVIIRHGLGDEKAEQISVMLVENCQRRGLTPLEKANAFGALRNLGLNMSEIARKVGVHPSTVSHYLTLLELDSDSIRAIEDGHLTTGDAITAVQETRKQQRDRKGAPQRGRPKFTVAPLHFSGAHPLARLVAQRCDHTTRPRVGGIGCGPCWEQTIRDDATSETDSDAPPPARSPHHLDEVAIMRRSDGDQSVHLTRPEKVELVRRWMASGRSLNECQRITGLTKVERYITRTEATA